MSKRDGSFADGTDYPPISCADDTAGHAVTMRPIAVPSAAYLTPPARAATLLTLLAGTVRKDALAVAGHIVDGGDARDGLRLGVDGHRLRADPDICGPGGECDAKPASAVQKAGSPCVSSEQCAQDDRPVCNGAICVACDVLSTPGQPIRPASKRTKKASRLVCAPGFAKEAAASADWMPTAEMAVDPSVIRRRSPVAPVKTQRVHRFAGL